MGLAMLCLIGSVASQSTAPLFFGYVVDSALKSMGRYMEPLNIDT